MVSNYLRSLPVLLALALSSAGVAVDNTIYIIPNAETPSLDIGGLTPIGLQRANNCLPPLMAPLNIGLVITCSADPDSGLCSGTVETATPIADQLGLTPDTSCSADDDDDCVRHLIKSFGATSDQAILVVWDRADIDDLFDDLNVDDDFDDVMDGDLDDDSDDNDSDDDCPNNDLLVSVVRKRVTAVISQACDGIDGQAPGTSRRSLQKRSFRKRQGPYKKLSRFSGRNH